MSEDDIWLRTRALFQQLKLTIARSWAALPEQAVRHVLCSFHHSTDHVHPTPPSAGLGWKATSMVTLTGRVEPVLSPGWWLAGRRMTHRTVAYLLGPVPPPARVIMNVLFSYILPKKVIAISCLFSSHKIRERNMFIFLMLLNVSLQQITMWGWKQ